jgi:molecular chaperone DnaJ
MRHQRRIKVRIPPGVATGNYLTLRGEGHYGPGGSGNIVIEVEEKPHNLFVRQGDNLFLELELPVWLAALGGEVEVPTLNGQHRLKIPAGVQSETVLRIRGGGLPHLGDRGRGDQMVVIKVMVPKHLSRDEVALYQKLAQLSTLSPKPRPPK